MNPIIAKLKHFDLVMAVICFLLLMIGLAIIYSTSLSDNHAIFYRQLIYIGIATVLFFFFAYFDFRLLTRISRYFYLFLFFALVLVLKFGQVVQGSARWFDLKVFSFQPAELAKLVLILVLARFFALRRGQINSWQNLLLSLTYAVIPIALILKEPDLGSAVVLFVIWLGMLMLSDVRKKVFVYLFVALSLVSVISWRYFLHDYQKTRIETFLDPNLDPRGRGYNVNQAIIAVGSGGFNGRGLGKGLQSQLKFLPERQTDFIFASAAEELGLIGAGALLILYFLLLYRLLSIYRNCRDDLSRFIIAGIFFMILGQVAINVGMNIGVLPVTGIPLPLVSYGGSSLLITAVSFGIAESVAIDSKGIRL